jgi:hypothetical protein
MNRTITIKHWQVCILLALSGFAVGTLLAKLTTALGF